MNRTFHINGRDHTLNIDPRETLLEVLRDQLALTGTKRGCDHGQCGACTVLSDGKRILSCLQLAATQRGDVTTIEGLAERDGSPHAMQAAFVRHDALQCGYCTPGQILSAIACIAEGHARSADDIRAWMSGNLCRCSAYPNILAAVMDVAGTKEVAR
jgi:xanthine dehydrogenase YagT iron-sulfur-binding subunit